MFDTQGQWISLTSYENFDNGFTDLTDLWFNASTTVSQALKDAALQHFKDDLEAAILESEGHKAKSRKFTSIAQELAEFEAVLQEEAQAAHTAAQAAKPAAAKSKKK
jgi:hypothetical protein